jgi:predicted GNAT family N-acyltransferase
MPGTPFINFLQPRKLGGYTHGLPREKQPPSVSDTFLDAMDVRNEVFVKEQGVPAEFEYDKDDGRCCHWVVYASVNTTDMLEVQDTDGAVIQPKRSTTRSVAIGTIRLVPFPHPPHPKDGEVYIDGLIKGSQEEKDKAADIAGGRPHAVKIKYILDEPTSFHDGQEPYLKLGRLAVMKEFRSKRIASLLVSTVVGWLKENATYFNPSVTKLGLEAMGATTEKEVPKWNGLICVHAQEDVKPAWEKWGFQVDEKMGRWMEEGIPHVGMWKRIEVV